MKDEAPPKIERTKKTPTKGKVGCQRCASCGLRTDRLFTDLADGLKKCHRCCERAQ